MDLSYSVLMPVYHKERAEYLKLSIDSMMTQTVRPSDFVIVCDGPLNDSLDQVLSECQASNPSVIQIVRLPQSAGVGPALNVGLDYCKHGLIARMDSDDIAVPNRIALQLQAFCDTPSLALCGGQIAEFMDNPSQICSRRVVPCEHKQIYQYAKKRNPMNHMTVMFRKTAVADAGGYQKMDFAEDYYLWARMLVKGYLAQNIDTVLVKARIGNGMYSRRGGLDYTKKILRLEYSLYQIGLLRASEWLYISAIRLLTGLTPLRVRSWMYQRLLRRR